MITTLPSIAVQYAIREPFVLNACHALLAPLIRSRNHRRAPCAGPRYVVTLAILLAIAGAASAAGDQVDPGELEGDWLNIGFVKEITRTRQSPQERNPGIAPEALQFGRRGGSLSLRINNFHEAQDARIRDLSRGADGRWRIETEGARPNFEFVLQEGGAQREIRRTGSDTEGADAFVHLPEGVESFVNGVTIAGAYQDSDGSDRIVFRADGTFDWKGREHRYEVQLDSSELGCSAIRLWPSLDDAAPQGWIGYRWREGKLLLLPVRLDDGRRSGFPIDCADTPIAELQPLVDSAKEPSQFEVLPLQALQRNARPVYFAERAGVQIEFGRNVERAGNPATEDDALLRAGTGPACRLQQDAGWFDPSGFRLSRDGRWLAVVLGSASGQVLRVVRVRDCAVRGEVDLPSNRLHWPSRGLLAWGACESETRALLWCFPASAWRVEADGRLRADASRAAEFTRRQFGMNFTAPRHFVTTAGFPRPVDEQDAARLRAER